MKTLITAVILLIVLGACQKENEELFPAMDEMSSVIINSQDSVAMGNLKISSSTIWNATNANQIPSHFFRAHPMYKNSYIHLRQRPGECSWTSYVLCVGSIARANGRNYPATYAKITAVRNACNNSSSINALSSYAANFDFNIVNRQVRSTPQSTGRFNMIKHMLIHINNHRTPFIALALDPVSGVGHYLTVWSIDWKVGGTGSIIYYTNTLLFPQSTFNGNLRSTSLTTFLNWMRDNPSANNYNCLFMWPR